VPGEAPAMGRARPSDCAVRTLGAKRRGQAVEEGRLVRAPLGPMPGPPDGATREGEAHGVDGPVAAERPWPRRLAAGAGQSSAVAARGITAGIT
jgi:hypothetical protein